MHEQMLYVRVETRCSATAEMAPVISWLRV